MPPVRILSDRRLWYGAALPCLVFLVAANFLIARLRESMEAQRRANMLMPAFQARAAAHGRYDNSVGEDPASHWGDIPDARKQPLVIVSGMSQMYAVNDMRPGDEIIVEHLDDALAPGARAFGLAAPNMNNEEALLYFLATAIDERTRPATFVYGVCFDKFRNVDLRPGLARFLDQLPGLREALTGACGARASRYPMACAKIRKSTEAASNQRPKAQEADVEHVLRRALGRVLPMVDQSAALNATTQESLINFRNWLFRIKSTTKRPMLESVYRLNQEFLALLADEARERGVTLVLYVIPLNPLADNPYVPAQYASFKVWVEHFASERGIPFANFENVVGAEDWGLAGGEPDFKHFRERGHEVTAAAILERFGPVLRGPSTSRASGATP